tara:strand:+ start:607 stop:780 length:174 start_codon:yes stop_codon:yes gene_type:complete
MNWGLILGVMSSILIFSYLWILWDIILNDWEKVDIDLDIEELEGDLYHGLHLQRKGD